MDENYISVAPLSILHIKSDFSHFDRRTKTNNREKNKPVNEHKLTHEFSK